MALVLVEVDMKAFPSGKWPLVRQIGLVVKFARARVPWGEGPLSCQKPKRVTGPCPAEKASSLKCAAEAYKGKGSLS